MRRSFRSKLQCTQHHARPQPLLLTPLLQFVWLVVSFRIARSLPLFFLLASATTATAATPCAHCWSIAPTTAVQIGTPPTPVLRSLFLLFHLLWVFIFILLIFFLFLVFFVFPLAFFLFLQLQQQCFFFLLLLLLFLSTHTFFRLNCAILQSLHRRQTAEDTTHLSPCHSFLVFYFFSPFPFSLSSSFPCFYLFVCWSIYFFFLVVFYE